MKIVSIERLSQEVKPDYFRGLSTFGAISNETVLRLVEQVKIIQLSPGEELYHMGEIGAGILRDSYW